MSQTIVAIASGNVPTCFEGFPPRPLAFWRQHTLIALLLFAPLAIICARTHIDLAIAHALFFDSVHQHWIGADSWFTNDLAHKGGQWLLRILAAAALGTWAATFFKKEIRALRRPTGFLSVSLVLSIGTVGLLKMFTNVHCPWDLQEFGASFPYVELFAHRPAGMATGHCFPAAHASSGYALFALYFLFRERSRRLSRLGLTIGTCAGLLFGLAQQSRGAHFVSHDLWSAFLVWMVSLTIYTAGFKARLWDWNAPWEFPDSESAASALLRADVFRRPVLSSSPEQ